MIALADSGCCAAGLPTALLRVKNASNSSHFSSNGSPASRSTVSVYGALIANPSGREQYDQIMEFPPFVGDIEQGRKIWETPFRNGKTFSDASPTAGAM
jgi:sulfur-oxidizing protein SoxA